MTRIEAIMQKISQSIANAYAILYGMGATPPAEESAENLAETAGTTKVVRFDVQELSEEQQEQARTNIGAASAEEVERLSEEVYKYKHIGTTPVVITEKVRGIVLSDDSGGEVSYTIHSPTVADMDSMQKTYTNCTVEQKDGYIEIKSAGSGAWYSQYVQYTVNGLMPGENYVLYIDNTELPYDSANHITYGYIVAYHGNTDGTLGEQAFNTNAPNALYSKLNAYSFTAMNSTFIVRYFIATSGDFLANVSVATFKDMYVNYAGVGEDKTSIIPIQTGKFTGSVEINGVFENVRVTSEPACTVSAKKLDDNSKPFYGKTIVCFGDSLFGYTRTETSVTARLAEHTGATVHNIGFGGCRMSAHPYEGYKEFSMYKIADAVVSGDFSAQEAGVNVDGIPEYFADHLATLKTLDFNAVDYVVIHYGTNDFTGGVSVDDTTNQKSTSTICGALRYSLDKLISAYPKLRVFVSVPVFRYWEVNEAKMYPADYTVADRTLLDVIDAIAETAENNCIPVINGYKGMGINQYNADTFLVDKTHHTVAGGERFGKFIGAQMIAYM